MHLQDEWKGLCNEHDSAWREYIRTSRSIRGKISSRMQSSGEDPTLTELAREHRAWHRVCEVREKMNLFLRQHFQSPEFKPRRRSAS